MANEDLKGLYARAARVKTDTEAIAVLGELSEMRELIENKATGEAAPLQREYEELDRRLDAIWSQARGLQAGLDKEIRRLGAVVAGTKLRPKHPMPRNKPVSEEQILEFFKGTNVYWRPHEIAQGVGVESTSAFRRMLRAMAEQGLIGQTGERGGSQYCGK